MTKRLRVDIAKRLEELGVDPLEGLVRIARRSEDNGNLALSAKILGDILQYTAPKLKSMEIAVEPNTLQYLERQERLNRIAQLLVETGVGQPKQLPVIEGEYVELKKDGGTE